MARIRKSDKNNTVKTQIVWKIGKYIRLSREDGNIVSESVVNQDQILNDEIPSFFEDGLYEVVDTYIDERIILGTSQEVLAPQGFPDLVLIFIWPEINGPCGRLIRKCVELSPLPIRRAA